MAANRVNPPKQLVLPNKISQDMELKKAFDDRDYILFQLWKRTGGGDDFVDSSTTTGYEFDDLILNTAKEQLLFDVVSTSVNYTTIGDQVIKCTDALTVTLNDEPEDQETAKILITNGDVTIDGNSRNIDGDTDVTIVFANIQPPATVDCLYLVDTDEWIIE